MHIETPRRYIRRQLGHQFHLHSEPRREFDSLILQLMADIPGECIGFDEDEFV